MEIKKIKQLSHRSNHMCELIKVSMSECEKLRKTSHNLKRVKIVPLIDYIVIVENIKLQNTIKTILSKKNQLKKDNAKVKKSIESNPLSKLQIRISHLLLGEPRTYIPNCSCTPGAWNNRSYCNSTTIKRDVGRPQQCELHPVHARLDH